MRASFFLPCGKAVTPFYQSKYLRLFPVTFLLMERLGVLVERNDHELTGDILSQVITECAGVEATEDALSYLLERLGDQAQVKQAGRRKLPGRSFGAALTDYFDSLDFVSTMTAAWGFAEARRMYCEEDKDDVLEALSVWYKTTEARHSMAWEAYMYAAGGKYKDDKTGEATQIIDLSQGGDRAIMELQKMVDMANEVFH